MPFMPSRIEVMNIGKEFEISWEGVIGLNPTGTFMLPNTVYGFKENIIVACGNNDQSTGSFLISDQMYRSMVRQQVPIDHILGQARLDKEISDGQSASFYTN